MEAVPLPFFAFSVVTPLRSVQFRMVVVGSACREDFFWNSNRVLAFGSPRRTDELISLYNRRCSDAEESTGWGVGLRAIETPNEKGRGLSTTAPFHDHLFTKLTVFSDVHVLSLDGQHVWRREPIGSEVRLTLRTTTPA